MISVLMVSLILLFWVLEGYWFDQPLPLNRFQHARRNLVVSILNIGVLAAVNIFIVKAAQYSQQQSVGLLFQFSFGVPVLMQVVFYDLLNYGIHRGLHAKAWLWRIHRGHHSDPYLDVTSAFRFNPLESILRVSIQGLVVFAVGIDGTAVVAYQVFVVAALLFSHANVRIPTSIENWLGFVLVLPSIHRFHHSQARREHDANYGIGLMIWDHIFGTYLKPKPVPEFVIGLEGYRDDALQSPGAILQDPFRSIERG